MSMAFAGSVRRATMARDDTCPVVPSGATQLRQGDFLMTWQTPQASDFRFGFEITMYVAAR
jgi:coenzyme PQQ precursor peptide PqqA